VAIVKLRTTEHQIEPVDHDGPPPCARLEAHRSLTALAVKWLRRPNSAGGHGCQIAMSEGWAGWGGEIPDAIGFRATGNMDGTVVVEVKVSRSDFLADARKPHRVDPARGVGRWRYYLCPEGLIDPAELPDRWGLLYATPRGVVRAIAGPAAAMRKTGKMFHQGRMLDSLEAHAFAERDTTREISMLVHMLARVGDAELLNARLREANARSGRLLRENAEMREELKKLRLASFLRDVTLETAGARSTGTDA